MRGESCCITIMRMRLRKGSSLEQIPTQSERISKVAMSQHGVRMPHLFL